MLVEVFEEGVWKLRLVVADSCLQCDAISAYFDTICLNIIMRSIC